MPAITLGLAEVEERLHAIRRRLNSSTTLHVAFIGLSIPALVAAVLVVLGLRGSAPAFGLALWTGAGLSIATWVGCVIHVRRRWVDLTETARLADQRAQLTDRLTTLADLRLRPRPARLAPVLVAQTLALGERWRVDGVAPRRVPPSVFLLLASLLVLAASSWLAPEPPPASQPEHATAGAPTSLDAKATLKAPPLDAYGPTQGQAATAAGPVQLSEVLPAQRDLSQSGTLAAQLPSDKGQPDDRSAALSERLQEAIRRAFHTAAVDQPRELASRSDNGSRNAADRNDERRSEGNTQHRNSAQPGKDAAEKKSYDGQTKRPDPSKPGDPSQHADANHPDQKFDGAAPAAGDGSSPNGLMDPRSASSTALGQGAPKTFKLTITSFLRSAEQRTQEPRRGGKRISSNGPAVATASSLAALNEQQLNDDALRKAEIPPEYEDIVRRVYSLRADQ
jgi:hypothetical protein